MRVSALQLLYIGFQHCRHAHLVPEAQAAVTAILPVVQRAQAMGKLDVEFPAADLGLFWEIYRTFSGADVRSYAQDVPELSAAGAAFLSVNILALEEAERLLAASATRAVRSLGYAFHTLPLLVGSPEQFDAEDFLFCVRIMAADWQFYSAALQERLCSIAGLQPEAMPQLLAQEGFVIDRWG